MKWFKTIYPNIRGEAAVRGMSIGDLAAVIGVSIPAMRRRLLGGKNGGTDFNAFECWKLCQYFEKSFEYLFEMLSDAV